MKKKVQKILPHLYACIVLLNDPISWHNISDSKFDRVNVTIFTHDNVSQDVSLSSLDLPLAWGYVLEEEFASVSGFILDGHFYGTVFLKDAVHFLEPMGHASR